MKKAIKTQILKNSIAHKISLWIFVISLVLATFASGVQIFVDYNRSMDEVQETLVTSNETFLGLLVESLWVNNGEIVDATLSGMLNYPYVEYIMLEKENGEQITFGASQSSKNVVYSKKLVKKYRGQAFVLGEIEVVADLDFLYARLYQKFLIQFFFFLCWALVLGLAVMVLFRRKVGIYLTDMAQYTSSMSINNLEQPMKYYDFHAEHAEKDEISILYDSFNRMRETLHESLNSLKKKEELLRQSEERYNLAMVASTDGLYDWNLLTNEIFLSKGWKQMLGYDDLELPNELSTWERLTKKEDAERAWQLLQELIKAGNSRFETEFQMRHKQGHFIDILSRAQIYYDEEENALRMVGTHVDITERKQAVKKLEEVLRFNEVIISESPIGISLYDVESGRCVVANDAIADLVGSTREVVLKQNFYNIESWQKSGILAVAEEVVATKNKKRKTFHVKSSFGKEIVIDCFLNQFAFEGRQHLLLAVADITKMVEAERKTQDQREKAQRYLNLAGVMFIGLDAAGKVNVANQKACEVLEIDQNEIIGMDWIENFIPSQNRIDVWSVFQKIMDGGIDVLEYYENPVVSKSGKYKYIAWHNTVITDHKDNVIGLLGSGEDITENKQLRIQLQQSQKMESIGTLAGGIAHDFNNLLSSILGFSELSLDSVEKGSDLEDNIHEVIAAGSRAKDLIAQILTFARQTDEVVEPIQVYTIVKEVIKFLKSSIPANIEIRQNIHSKSYIMGSPTQVHQIVMNLCTNAFQAMEESGGVLEINLKDIKSTELPKGLDLGPGDYICIEVRDTGTGIAPEIISNIYDPYFTTKGVGAGTGMGLSVVHGIVTGYEGQIKVDSSVNEGAVFSVFLPVTENEHDTSMIEGGEVSTGSENILFVDDEEKVAKMAGRILEQLGYTVTTRTSSVEALELFRSTPENFDLVISDMTMPGMTGDTLAVKLMEIKPELPVIICTGYSKKISEKIAEDLGIKAVVYKPFIKNDFATIIRSVLDDALGK